MSEQIDCYFSHRGERNERVRKRERERESQRERERERERKPDTHYIPEFIILGREVKSCILFPGYG